MDHLSGPSELLYSRVHYSPLHYSPLLLHWPRWPSGEVGALGGMEEWSCRKPSREEIDDQSMLRSRVD